MIPQIILLSSSRSGTNYFLDIFSHCFPNDIVLREIFRKEGDSLKIIAQLTGMNESEIVEYCHNDPIALWKRIIFSDAAINNTVIAKAFYYHAPRESNLWSYFKDNTFMIHLMRKNLLNSYVSLKIAQSTGIWISRRPDEERTLSQISIDASDAEQFVRVRASQISWARAFFSGSNYREVLYEDIQASSHACAHVIVQMKIHENNPSEFPVESAIKKQIRPLNSELILNYDEVSHLDRHWEELNIVA